MDHSTPNTPIEDSPLSACCAVRVSTDGQNRICPNCSFTCDFMSGEVIAWKDKAVAEAQSRHITDLARAVGILQGLGHPDVLLERHYNEAVARLTTPTKEREEDNE